MSEFFGLSGILVYKPRCFFILLLPIKNLVSSVELHYLPLTICFSTPQIFIFVLVGLYLLKMFLIKVGYENRKLYIRVDLNQCSNTEHNQVLSIHTTKEHYQDPRRPFTLLPVSIHLPQQYPLS